MHRPERILPDLIDLYGPEAGGRLNARIRSMIAQARSRISGLPTRPPLTEADLLVIAYPDHIREPGRPPLQTLADFCERKLAGLATILHILPFFPSSSDDGFSVIDYERVDPALGGWEDLARLRTRFRLMADAVINHVSAQSHWFLGFLAGQPDCAGWFIVVEEDTNVSRVRRPRALPLIHQYSTARGPVRVWTTFSADQIDLNYRNPDVLLHMLGLLTGYAARGVEFLRLDAVGFLWKEPGTECVNLPQTHALVRIFRAALEAAAPGVKLVAETNVPHAENIAYFGDGSDEAHLVYNFALPPLVLHTLLSGDADALSRWAAGLAFPPGQTTFLNFLASHDGIGLNSVRGILAENEMDALVEAVLARGGLVSWKDNEDGSRSVYELNINFRDAVASAVADQRVSELAFLAAHRILLSFRGLPAMYLHSLLGSRGWKEGPALTGSNRSINREKLDRARLDAELDEPASSRHRIFAELGAMIERRRRSPAFHPAGDQRVLSPDGRIFGLLRTSPDGTDRVWYLQNVTGRPLALPVDFAQVFGDGERSLIDLATDRRFASPQERPLLFEPYQGYWVKVIPDRERDGVTREDTHD